MNCLKLVIFEISEQVLVQNIYSKVLIFDRSLYMHMVFNHVIIHIFFCKFLYVIESSIGCPLCLHPFSVLI